VIAAGTIGIVYLLGSDIRGRAAAMVATIDARQQVACVFIQEAQRSHQDAETEATPAESISLPGIVAVKNSKESGNDESGWKAIAAREQDGKIDYLLVKGKQTCLDRSRRCRLLLEFVRSGFRCEVVRITWGSLQADARWVIADAGGPISQQVLGGLEVASDGEPALYLRQMRRAARGLLRKSCG